MTWKALQHQNVLPLLGIMMSNNQFAMVSEWMGSGNINEFIKAHRDENRFELVGFWFLPLTSLYADDYLVLVAQRRQSGIDIYARRGDDTRGPQGGRSSNTDTTLLSPDPILSKANILINRHGHACLADFGLITIVSDPAYPSTISTSSNSGTPRWMSPELLDPDQFGFKDGRPTKESDCYALGMVVYEVLRGQAPFTQYKDFIVMRKVIEGQRPERPQEAEGVWFTEGLWGMLEQCWSPRPKDRPTITTVLAHLEQGSTTWQPLPPGSDDEVQSDSDNESHSTASYHPRMFLHFTPNHVLTFKHPP